MVRANIEWKFNPLTVSYIGGEWECMIGLMGRVHAATLPRTVKLTDEIMSAILCEAECTVNDRPLTKLTDDANDNVPLTSNHLFAVTPGFPLGSSIAVICSIGAGKNCQHLANQFYRMWLKLYLPELQKHHK